MQQAILYSVSCREEKQRYQQWVRSKVDYNQEVKKKPYTFYDATSFYDSLLPPLSSEPEQVQRLFMSSIRDQDMESDLKAAGILNWCPEAIKLHAVSVPRDGNCLLHSASIAIWGVEDSKNTLRELMLMTIKHDYHNSYRTRWWRQRLLDLQSIGNNMEGMVDEEWEDVIRTISNLGSSALSTAVPHRFLESIHIYVLANILRRPIVILTENMARSLAGHGLQESHIGGLYLPLEWHHADCCKTPVIIGYSYNHFCPLISISGEQRNVQERPRPFPLVDKDLAVLPVRFLLEQEEREAWNLVQVYLDVTEREVEGKDHTKTQLPFANLTFKSWSSDGNLFYKHLKITQQKYRESAGVGRTKSKTQHGVVGGTVSIQHQQNQFYQIQLNSQTEVVPVRGTRGQGGHPKAASGQETRRPVSTTTTNAGNEGNASKCVNTDCKRLGIPNHGNLCDECLKNLTIAESGAELVSMQEGDRHFYVLKENESQVPGVTENVNPQELIPTAPPPSNIELESFSEPSSMMAERCKTPNCGYRCSQRTYPYCHECHSVLQEKQRKEQAKMAATAPVANASGLILDAGQGQEFAYPEASVRMNIVNLSIPSASTGSFTGSSGSSEMTWPIKSQGNISNPGAEEKIRNDIPWIGSGKQQMFEGASKSARAGESGINGQSHSPSQQSQEGFAETETKTPNGDVVVSKEPSVESKCVSPYCQNIVLPPECLCQRCKDILKKMSEKNSTHEVSSIQATARMISAGKEIEDQRIKEDLLKTKVRSPPHHKKQEVSHTYQAQRGNHCKMENCPNFGDPAMDNMCSSCFFKNKPVRKALTSPIASKKKEIISGSPKFSWSERITQPVEGLQQLSIISQQTAGVEHRSISEQQVVHHPPAVNHIPATNPNRGRSNASPPPVNLYPFPPSSYDLDPLSSFAPTSSHWNSVHPTSDTVPTSASFIPKSPHSLMVTSKTSATPVSENISQIPVMSSQPHNHEADQEFRARYQGIEENMRNASKCVMSGCQNFGNSQKNGYCNACFTVYKQQLQRERELEYGEDVPDKNPLH